MKNIRTQIFAALAVVALSPLAVIAKNPASAESGHAVQGNNFGIVASYSCAPGSATYLSGPGKPGFLLKNTNHTYGCSGAPPTGGGAGVNYLGQNVGLMPFTGLSFSLRNGKNGTVNVYLLTENAPYPTYSVSFSNLLGADFSVTPAQFNPPVASGTQVLGVVIDANPCQQVLVKHVSLSGTPGILQVHGTPTCPLTITCQPPN